METINGQQVLSPEHCVYQCGTKPAQQWEGDSAPMCRPLVDLHWQSLGTERDTESSAFPCLPVPLCSLSSAEPGSAPATTKQEGQTEKLHFQMWPLKGTFCRFCSKHKEQNQAALSGTQKYQEQRVCVP